MILVQEIVDRMVSSLDAEGSDRYRFDQDLKPAINSSIEWLVLLFNKAFGDNKLSEESLDDLVKVAVFQTSQYSRLNTGLLSDEVWTLLRINPESLVIPSTAQILPSEEYSILRDDVSFLKSSFSAKRLSLEQWEDSSDNIFEAGNESIINNSFKTYAYLNNANYSGVKEYEIKPNASGQFIGVVYLKVPSLVQNISDSIEFPKSLTNLVFEKALSFISIKQGDQTNLYSITSMDINTLTQLMI